jgi:hypothetical protein
MGQALAAADHQSKTEDVHVGKVQDRIGTGAPEPHICEALSGPSVSELDRF